MGVVMAHLSPEKIVSELVPYIMSMIFIIIKNYCQMKMMKFF